MDKHTLSQYGWVVSVILVLAIMISLATPFASVLGNGFKGAVNQFKNTSSGVLDNMGGADSFGDLGGGASGGDHGMGEGGPVMLEGQDQSFHKFAPTTLTFRSSANIEDFQEVQVNGETIDPSNYTVSEGSTVVTMSVDYLMSLNADVHQVKIVSNTGSPTTEFEVVQPEVNEYGFYYNQPYAAQVDVFGGTSVFFFREDGTMDFRVVETGYTEKASFTSAVNSVQVSAVAGVFDGSVSSDGTEIYCPQLAITFALGNETIVADEEYIYVYDASLDGYVVTVINKTQAEYADIRTGINGKPTVKVAELAFVNHDLNGDVIDNTTLEKIPNIPNSVTIIGAAAFGRCVKLTNVSIPDGVIEIGNMAFGYCSALTKIVFNGTVEQWNAIAKSDDWNLGVPATEVQCSDGVVSLS